MAADAWIWSMISSASAPLVTKVWIQLFLFLALQVSDKWYFEFSTWSIDIRVQSAVQSVTQTSMGCGAPRYHAQCVHDHKNVTFRQRSIFWHKVKC